MTPTPVLGVLLALSALALAASVGWIVAGLAGLVIQRVRKLPPTLRASLLAQARLTPLGLVLCLVSAQMIAFARFETGGGESAGPLLIGGALVGAALLVDAITTGVRSWRRTRLVVATWRASATPFIVPSWIRRAWIIRRRFPVVAVVGIVRPQLFIATQVAADCTGRELAAIAAHETAHVESRDNLIRLLFCVTPGARIVSAIGDRLEHAWMAAAERAADSRARRRADGLELAAALTKVARLAVDTEPEPEAMPASALIGGPELESRVRRLLEPAVDHHDCRFAWAPVALLVVAAAAIQMTPALAGLHELFELLVRR